MAKLLSMLNIYANISGKTGYALHGLNFFKALNKLTPLCLIPKNGALPEAPDQDIIQMISRIPEMSFDDTAINLDFGVDLLRFGGKNKIAYTVFETTIPNLHTLNALKQMDQVWVPTSWAKDILISHQIPKEIIKVIPEGIDPEIFNNQVIPFAEFEKFESFRFLSVGKWEARKNPQQLLKAFDMAFEPHEPVHLVVQFNSEIQGLQKLDVKKEIAKLGLKNHAKIITVDQKLAQDSDMAKLYKSCHCLASATRAEGWGLPLIEAMACGLPVIAPAYSGPTAYMTPQNSYPIPIEGLEDAYCPLFFQNKGQHGQWAKIKTKTLADQMRYVYENQDHAQKIGQAAATEIQQNWTWKHAAQKAFEALRHDYI